MVIFVWPEKCKTTYRGSSGWHWQKKKIHVGFSWMRLRSWKLCLMMTFTQIDTFLPVPAGSPSRVVDVAVYVFDKKIQPSLPTPFYSVLVSDSVLMALSTLFHSINSPDNSPLSHSVLPVSFLPYWSFQLHISA